MAKSRSKGQLRPKSAADATVAPKVASGPPGGTPKGWTFWSTAARCWREFFFRYILTLVPYAEQEHFTLGSIYHALHEGVGEEEIKSWGASWEKLLPEGKRLFESRLKGPPMPKATAVEQTLSVPGLPMTTKPDREEKTFGGKSKPRDFKTTGWFGDHDAAYWQVNGQIIGQMMATGSQTAELDMIHKRTGETKLLTVELTPEKEQALVAMVSDLYTQLQERLVGLERALEKGKNEPKWAIDQTFTPDLTGCVGKYGPCPYYARCWKSGPEKFLYKLSERRQWLEGEGESTVNTVMEISKKVAGAL